MIADSVFVSFISDHQGGVLFHVPDEERVFPPRQLFSCVDAEIQTFGCAPPFHGYLHELDETTVLKLHTESHGFHCLLAPVSHYLQPDSIIRTHGLQLVNETKVF